MGINLEAHGYNEVAETNFDSKPTNDQHRAHVTNETADAQVTAETSQVNSGEKKSPANTDEKFLNNQENNCCANSTTATPKTQPANVVRLCDKQSRIAEAKKFFDAIFGNVTGDFYSYLWTLENHYTIPFRVSTEKARAAMAERAINLSDSGKTVFFGVNCGSDNLNSNERYKANVPKNQKPDAPPIKLVTLQTVTITDIDIEGGTHKTDAKKAYAPDFDTAKSFLPFTPSIVVNSGYGLHAYCIYREPIAVTDDNRKAVNKRNVDYIAAVRQRSGDCSKTADGVGDVSRVLRVPGTFNYKLGVKPDAPLCHVVDWNDVQFTVDEMDSKLAEFFKQNAPQPQQEIFTPPPEIKIAPPPEPSRENFIGLDDDGPSEIERALAMLPYVDGGSYDTWYKAGFILKKIGCTFNDWASWSATQPNYQPDKPGYNMEYMWEHFPEENALNINTLHMWAREGGYSEKVFQREWYSINRPNQSRKKSAKQNIYSNVDTSQLADTDATQAEPIDPQVAEWEEARGEKADPQLLPIIDSAARYLDGLTVENITSVIAQSAKTKRAVALCQFYDFNVAAAESFFVKLEAVQKVAKDRLPFYNELDDAENPDEQKSITELKSLAMLSIPTLRKSIAEHVTIIKREHKSFQKKCRREAFQADQERIRAEVDAYKKSKVEEIAKLRGEPKSADRDAKIVDCVRAMCDWREDKSDGTRTVKTTADNANKIFSNDPTLDGLIGFDEFQQADVFLKRPPWRKDVRAGDVFGDRDASQIRFFLRETYSEFGNVGTVDDAIVKYSDKRSFHPVKDYFSKLPAWDGQERAETIFIKFLGVKDTPFAREITRKWLLAAFARIYFPGCDFQAALVLHGNQGIGKGFILRRLGGKWYGALNDNVEDPHAIDDLQNLWIVELKEMTAMRKAELNAIKSFIDTSEDNRRPAYAKRATQTKRHCVFAITVNDDQFLRDATGNRRFWILECGNERGHYVEGLTDEFISQLWAEVKLWAQELLYCDADTGEYMINEKGFELSREAKLQVENVADRFMADDGLKGTIRSYLDQPIPPDVIFKLFTQEQRRKFVAEGKLFVAGGKDELVTIRRTKGGVKKDIDNDIAEIRSLIDSTHRDILWRQAGEGIVIYGTERRRHVCAAEIFIEHFNAGDKRRSMFRIHEVLATLENWVLGEPIYRDFAYGRQNKVFYRIDEPSPETNTPPTNDTPPADTPNEPQTDSTNTNDNTTDITQQYSGDAQVTTTNELPLDDFLGEPLDIEDPPF